MHSPPGSTVEQFVEQIGLVFGQVADQGDFERTFALAVFHVVGYLAVPHGSTPYKKVADPPRRSATTLLLRDIARDATRP